MKFYYTDPNKPSDYIEQIKRIIRKGINVSKNKMNINDNEGSKNQLLVEKFNIQGAKNEKDTILCGKEHTKGVPQKEDIYFYLGDDDSTRLFYIEGKRLPKPRATTKASIYPEEYVKGKSSTGKPSGGIERYKLGLHGEPNKIKTNGMIAYIERDDVSTWHSEINKSISKQYPKDTKLSKKRKYHNEFESSHHYIQPLTGKFTMYHFWIDLTQ